MVVFARILAPLLRQSSKSVSAPAAPVIVVQGCCRLHATVRSMFARYKTILNSPPESSLLLFSIAQTKEKTKQARIQAGLPLTEA